ncbi:MAG TPA: hypothetical protein VKY19_12555 [Ktedonosporobacter sp.]|nr:hypothetical protein [Ktedonosporobacter sp.]
MTLPDAFSSMRRWGNISTVGLRWNGGEPDAINRVPTKGVHPSSPTDALNLVATKGRTSLTT